jgi:outer membrane protein assembly factor BamA
MPGKFYIKSNALLNGIIFLFALVSIVHPQDSVSVGRSPEQVKKMREIYKSKNTAEKIISFPGKVLVFPLDVGLEGIKYSIKVYDETKIGPKFVDLMTADNGLRGVVPTYASRTGAGFTFYQKDVLNTGTKYSFIWTLGLENKQKIEMDFKGINFGQEIIHGRINAAYNNLDGEHFYGLGPNSIFENEYTFGHSRTSGDISVGLNLWEQASITTAIGIESNDVNESNDSDDPSLYNLETWPLNFGNNLPGLFDKVNLSSFRIEFLLDSKNRPGNPTKGMDVWLSSGVYNQYDGDEYGFTKTIADVSKYVHLFYSRVVVLRLATQITSSRNGGAIPFYYLSELGNDETIRGFQRGRYRDKDYLLGSIEYRFPFTRNVDALVFTDAGKVSPNIADDFDGDDLNVTFGGGLRFYSEKGLIARLELGKSGDGFRLLFKLN